MRKLLYCAVLTMLSVPAFAQVTNGDFSTGDLTGWSVFTTANGTANGGSPPNVTLFDVTGSGASLAAHFKVGQLTFVQGAPEGGGIFQNIFFGASDVVSFSADIAALGGPFTNVAGGNFQMLLDGTVIDSVDFGQIGANAIKRDSLSASENVSAGSHELRFKITRPFLTGTTPQQYIDNILVVGTLPVVPEPSSAVLLAAGGLPLAGIVIRRRKS